ncbi:hypothetical protein IGI04_010949 [Brassica rapa subsp. trilocularis]|uniref:Nodulin-like domain-containing protein n=1 Tax=Brassica rapa subsp. trilocularis TaxID=1813537 RepID=A0ABQ7N412_BRACM|nr:hypothetical protein IGI04_010949 [Brassica rapa subsp. trilocularis]
MCESSEMLIEDNDDYDGDDLLFPWIKCMKLFSMTRMLGTVSYIGVNRSQTLAFGTLQGE